MAPRFGAALRAELDGLGERPHEWHGRSRRWWRRRIGIDRSAAAPAASAAGARAKHQRTEELEAKADVVLRQHGRNRREPIAHDLPTFFLRRSARRRAQDHLKTAAADRRAEGRVLAELGQLRRERGVVAVHGPLHRQVHDRRADLEFGEECPRRLHSGGTCRPERPVDAGVADARGEPRLLRPAYVASDSPRRKRDEHAGLRATYDRRLQQRERRGAQPAECRALQELAAIDHTLHALSLEIVDAFVRVSPAVRREHWRDDTT